MSEFLDLVNNLRTSNQQVAISSSADPANDFGNDAVRNVAIALQTGQQANSVNFDLAKSYITRFCDSSVSSSLLYNVSDAAKPSFNYARNSISIPSRSANPGLYNDKGAFYNQIFHEVSHYTRAQLGISGVISGTPEYQKEEVIAEMTACKMMMNCGFPVANLRTSARYIDAWANEYVKNLPEAEKAAAKAELLSDAEKSADEALKLVHLNIGMNQRYEMNQDLKMRLIVPADEVKLALARGVRQDEKGYYVRISDDFSKFERWSEKNMLETAIQYSRKAVNEAAPEIRQDKENELNTAIQEAQKQAEAEEAQKASVVTSSADNIDQREEISVASSEQSNAPNVPDSNSVNASLIAEIQRMQQQLAELQKQLAATQKENEELRNGQQRAENAGRARENSGVNKSDNGEISGRRAGELQKDTSGHGTEIYVGSMGISPDENDKQTLGEDSSPVLSPRAERGGNAAERDNDKVLQSGLHSGSNVNHQQSGSEAGITGNSGNFEGSRRLNSDSGRDIEASGHSQDEVSAGNLYGQGDIPRAGNRNDGSVYEGLRQSDGSDIQMVEEGRSRTADTSVLPGEQTGNRGSADRFSEHSDKSRAVSDNSGRDDGANRSSDRRGGEGRETGGNRGTSDHAGRRLSDGTSGNVREEGASGLSSDGGRLVSESGRGRSEQLQGEILGGSGSVLESAVASQNIDNAVKESDAQEVHPITAEQTEIRESSAQQSENEEEAFPKTQEEYDSLRYIELSDQEKHDAVTMAVWEWVSWQGSLAELTEQTDDLVKREQQQQFENILIDRVTEKLSKSGWASLVQFARTPVESPFYDESRYVALEEVLDQIDYIYRIHKEEINNALFSVNEQQTDIQEPLEEVEKTPAPAETQSNTQNNSSSITEEHFLKNVIYHSILDCVELYATYNQNITAKMYLDGTLRHSDIKESTEQKVKDNVELIYSAIKNLDNPNVYHLFDVNHITNAVRTFLESNDIDKDVGFINHQIEKSVEKSKKDNHFFDSDAMQEIIGEMQESHSGYPTYDEVLANLAKIQQQALAAEENNKEANTVTQSEAQETAQPETQNNSSSITEELFLKNVIYHSILDCVELYATYNQNITAKMYLDGTLRHSDIKESTEQKVKDNVELIYSAIKNLDNPNVYHLFDVNHITNAVRTFLESNDIDKDVGFINHQIEKSVEKSKKDNHFFDSDAMQEIIGEMQESHSGYPTYDEVLANLAKIQQQALAAEENNKEANTVTQTETQEPVQKSEERTENVVSEQQNISQSVSENTTEQTASSPSDDVLPEIKEKRAKKSRKKKNSDQIDLFDDVQNKADENQETTNEEPVISSAATEPAPSAVSEKAEAEQEPTFTIADNWEIHDDDSRATTPVDRFVRNLEAIETLRKIQNEGDRPATKEEQEKLAQFSGWGGLGSQFYVNDNSSALEKERRQKLMDLLGEEEFYKARASSITAYYTDPVVARSIYQALENAGFKGGNILEPSCGTGIFFGTMPRDMMANSVINGVELEPTTAQIAQKLYPTVKIKNCGYEKSGQRNDSYDVIIGNVPFGNFSVVDGKYSDKRDLIHNYFIDKSVDQVKPGGIVALITSSSTLEDKDPEFRTRIAEKAELMGAIRLPDNAFSHTGTNVQTDILFFKKRKERIQNVSETENPWIATTKYQLLDSYSNSKSLFLQNVYDSGNCNNSKFINKVELKDRFYKNVSWADWKSKDNDFLIEKSLPSLNDYYRQNSAMCINYNTLNKNQYGKLQLATTESLDLKQDLDNKIQLIRGTFSAEASKEEGVKKLDPEDYPEIKYFSFGIIDGKIYHKRPSGMILAEGLKINETDSKAKETIKDISGLKKCLELKQIYFQTLNAMLSDATDDEVKNLQSELVDKYNQVREELGIKKDASLFLSNANAMKAFRLDSEFSKIKVMENIKDVYEPTVKTKTTTDKISGEKTTEQVEATKHIRLFTGLSDICKKRVLHKYDTSYHADNSISALDLSLGVKGYVDFSFMSQISSKPADDIKKELSDNSLIFRDLDDADKWLPKEEFLSGDIQAKLIKAEKIQESDTSFATEVKALKEAMPRPVKFDEIDIGVSSPFVPVDILARYVAQEMDCSESDVNVTRKLSGEYSVLLRRVGAGAMSYSLDGLKLNEFVSKVLNHKPIAFFHDKEHKNIDKERTFAGNITYRERFEQNFKSYISKISAEDRIRIEESYNRSFNTIVHRKYDGNKLLFAGISSEIKLRDHQKDAVARCIYGGNTLLAHEVGAGKTFTICAAAMEMKRLGLSQKPLIAVPGAVVGQWEDEFQRLYPNANILVVKKGDMSPGSINSTIMKMALNDWDSIIISHGDLAKIPVANETIDLVLHEREKEIRQIADEDDDLTPGQREEFIISNMNKLHKRVDKIREKYANGNAILTMGDIGIDKLFVDESHEFKNLKVETTLDNIVGLSKSEALKTEDMFIKTTYLNNKSNYHAVYFASGTPISNTLGELYSVQKYLQPQILDSSGCNTFQKWADTFVNITYDRQVSMTGKTLNMKMQMKEFKNIPALLNMYWKCGDVVMTDDLGLNLPKVERKNVIIKPTENQEELIERITQRMADIEKRRVDPKKDNKLCIAGDSRKIGMDPRLLREKNLERMGMTEDEIGQGNKIDTVCANVYKIYKETDAQKSTQVIFSDIGVPNKDGYFSVYDEIKDQLIQRGIPANEIAIIHDYPKDDDKKALFGRLNAGDIRVVIGSTGKLGTGCNFQKKLIAAHHVDAPWRPSDITQREGRIKRQGNENSSVQIFTYATEKTFDAYMYDTLARKQEYIKTIFSGKEKIQRTEDLGEVELDYRSMRIATCGDQNLKKKLELLDNIKNHRMIKSAEEDKLQKFKDEISFLLPNRIEASNKKIAEYSYAVELRKAHPPIINEKGERIFSGFEMPDGRELTDKKDMMTWLQNSRPGHIGSYRGFQIYKFYLRDNGTGDMTYKIGITPKKFDSLLEQQNFGNDRSNTTLIFGGIEHNWDSRIDKWADKLNDELKFVEEKQKEINDASITIQAIEKEIQFQNDLIAEAQKEYDELESQSQTKSEDMEQFDSEKADTSALQDVECDSSDIVELLNEREKDDEEESQYSLPEGYEDQYYEPVGQEAQDLIPEEDKRHYIDVPFNEKNEAKALGAKWDQENKGWYVPEGVNMADFAKWPEKQKSEMPARDYIKVPMKDKDEAKALGARWDKDNKLWFIPKNANADLFAKWPRTSIAEKKAEQERKPVYSPRVTLYVPFSRKEEAKKLGAYWDARSKQWTCKAEDKAKFSEFLKPLPRTESKVRENTDRINHEPNVQSTMLRDLASAGVRIDAVSIQNTGKWIRVPLIDDKPGEKTGMLAIHLDGVPTMKFVNFRHPELSIPMNTENKVRLYVGDLEQIKQSPQAGDRLKTVTEEAKARIAANQAAREAEREKAQKSAQAKSEYFSKMPTASENSQYLVSKGIKPSPDLHQNQKSGDLFVPFYDADGKIKTTQIIHADGRKQFIEGGQKGGSFHPLDGIQSLAERDTIYICEGYATANTIREATKEKMAVVAAGDCGNLLSVATAIHEKFPEKAIVIAGDDDRFNEVNSGRNHAESTARAIGATVVFPDFDGNSTGTDFNDMAKEKGIEAVRDVLRNEYRQHRSAAEAAAPEKQPEKAKKPGYRR